MSYLHDRDDEDLPIGMVVCDRCAGAGVVDCRCAGEFCVCGAEEIHCPVCMEEGVITADLATRRAENFHQMMKAIWGGGL